MKKFLFVALVAVFAAFTACNDDDKEAQKYQVTVKITCDEAELSSMSSIKATAVSESGSVTTVDAQNGVAILKLVAGSYTISVVGDAGAYNYVGSTRCVVAEADVPNLKVSLIKSKPTGKIIFKEVYSTGVKSFYWTDGFYELFNNSDEVQYLDGIIMGIVQCGYGDVSSWADDEGNLPDYYPMGNHTVFFPGSGNEYPVQPGQSVVVATRAINHSARELGENDSVSPVDLSAADWEIFIPTSAQDTDNPDVPNLEVAYSQFGFDFMPSVSGQALILAKLPADSTMESFVANNALKPEGQYRAALCIPSEYVIDAVDIVYFNEDLKKSKTILDLDDSGYTYYSGSDDEWTDPMYCGKSLRRKCVGVSNGRAYFKDTNNSSDDFILGGQKPVIRRTFTSAD
ncbi:MAG: DUF4876 domain-containing protein [Bacteroidaceae bacterium]|nr:DUF4876 domain-containing protein [Bacteroidaceae bacterium]